MQTGSPIAGIKEIKVYDSDEATPLIFDENKFYYGNVDQVISNVGEYWGWRWMLQYHNDQDGNEYSIWNFNGENNGYPLIRKKQVYSHSVSVPNDIQYPNIAEPYVDSLHPGYDLTRNTKLKPL